jgi:hypothetical protein
MVGVLMSVGVMTVGVMSVGEITVGVMTVGVMTVGVMRRSQFYISSRKASLFVTYKRAIDENENFLILNRLFPFCT